MLEKNARHIAKLRFLKATTIKISNTKM